MSNRHSTVRFDVPGGGPDSPGGAVAAAAAVSRPEGATPEVLPAGVLHINEEREREERLLPYR